MPLTFQAQASVLFQYQFEYHTRDDVGTKPLATRGSSLLCFYIEWSSKLHSQAPFLVCFAVLRAQKAALLYFIVQSQPKGFPTLQSDVDDVFLFLFGYLRWQSFWFEL
jgi:hypothetical protein